MMEEKNTIILKAFQNAYTGSVLWSVVEDDSDMSLFPRYDGSDWQKVKLKVIEVK